MSSPSEELAKNQEKERVKLNGKLKETLNNNEENSFLGQGLIIIDEISSETDTVPCSAKESTIDDTSAVSGKDLPLAYQSSNDTEPSKKHLPSSFHADLDKPVKSKEIDLLLCKDQVSKSQSTEQINNVSLEKMDVIEKPSYSKDFTNLKINECFEELEYSFEQNDCLTMIYGRQYNYNNHKKYTECDRAAKRSDPVKNSNLRSQRRIESDYGYRNEIRIEMFREYRDKCETTNHRENLGKSNFKYGDRRCRPRFPTDSRSDKNDTTHTRNMYERGSESKSTGGSFKGNYNKARSRSKSRSRSPKRQSHMERLLRNKSPKDIKKTFMDIMFGDKDKVIKKETASSSLIDFVFDKGNKAHNSEFINVSSSTQLPSHPMHGSYPEPVYGFEFSVKAEKRDNFAQETLHNNFYSQPQFQKNQPYLGNYQAAMPVPCVNIKIEPQVQRSVGHNMSNFAPSQAFGPQHSLDYEEMLPYNYNVS